MTHRLHPLLLMAAVLLLAACQAVKANETTGPTPTPLLDLTGIAADRSLWTQVPVAYVQSPPTATRVPPTAAVSPTVMPTLVPTLMPTITPTATPTETPGPTLVPTNTLRPTTTLAPTLAQTVISTNIPGPFGGDTATWTPPPPVGTIRNHFIFQRPIDKDHTDYWARNYSYGSTDSGSRPVHHGLDLLNPLGTPVLAAADGVVYYAGPDKTTMFGPQTDFYGNVIVIQHYFQEPNGQSVFSLYGHLSKVEVQKNQAVKAGQLIGLVGSEGVATGSHLHFEVRVGYPKDYRSTRNPELWIIPYAGHGVLVGRVMDLTGRALPNVLVEARAPMTYSAAPSYADDTVNGDSTLHENFAVPDLPVGYYTVFVRTSDGSLRFRTVAYVYSDKMTWIDIYLDTSATP